MHVETQCSKALDNVLSMVLKESMDWACKRSRWRVEGSKGSGLPWRKLAFQMFQAAILSELRRYWSSEHSGRGGT